MEEFDVCIVGAGTWGSAVAYHLTLENHKKLRVCLIGPEEPKDRAKATIFGSYFDESRLTKSADQNVIWGELAKRSIAMYRDVERKSGITFFEDVGYLFLGSTNIAEQQKNLHSTLHIPVTELTSQQINKKFPFLETERNLRYIYCKEQCGYINVRRQRLAHQKLAKRQGCIIILDIVDSIHDYGNNLHLLTTKTGMKISSRKVLLTTGCFTGFRNLLPANVVPDMAITTERVLLLEMSKGDAYRMKSMPSILYSPDDMSNSGYLLPPIRYPDGKYYLKVGHGMWGNKPLETNQAVINHFRDRGPSSVGLKLYKIMRKIMTDFRVLSVKYDTCVTGKTSTGYLYCDMVTSTLGILVGGNGYGAKSADEIGRMGARMIRKCDWDHDLPASKFRIKLKPLLVDSQL